MAADEYAGDAVVAAVTDATHTDDAVVPGRAMAGAGERTDDVGDTAAVAV